MSVEEAYLYLRKTKCLARPIGEIGSPWQTVVPETKVILDKMAGESAYKARIGARVEPYGVYWVEIVNASNSSKPIVVNVPEKGKTLIDKIPPRRVESEFLFPALRGRDIRRWGYEHSLWVFILNRSTKRDDWVEEKIMRRKWPLTFEYLNEFKDVLLARANYWKFFGRNHVSTKPLPEETEERHARLKSRTNNQYQYEISEAPFYNMFNIGPYTFAPFRVCWSRMTNTIKACVVSQLETILGTKTLIPTDTATIVPFNQKDEAHYFCAVVNSSPFRWYVQSFSSAGRGFGTSGILKRIRIDKFNAQDQTHKELAAYSESCHDAVANGDESKAEAIELEVDLIVTKLWGLSVDELDAIRETLE